MRTAPGADRPRVVRRRLDGLLLLDKPVGPSSNDALIRARRLFRAEKAGHGGTLDPLATGLLPVAFGEATKYLHGLLESDKTYLATVALGATTTTGDAEGEIVERRAPQCSVADVEAALARLTGPGQQVPPMHSALKRDGRPLYEYARAGLEVERAPRPVTIHALTLVGASLPGEIVVRAVVSKGTYVRVLAEDIGRALGCGAHLRALRRERTAGLDVGDAVTLEALAAMDEPQRDACLRPVDAIVSGLPAVALDATQAARLAQGQRLKLPPPAVPGPVRVVHAGRFLGTAELESDGRLVPLRLLSSSAAILADADRPRTAGHGGLLDPAARRHDPISSSEGLA